MVHISISGINIKFYICPFEPANHLYNLFFFILSNALVCLSVLVTKNISDSQSMAICILYPL